MQKKYILLLLLSFVLFNSQAQMVGIFELGTGTQGKEWLRYEASGAFGYNLLKSSLCVFGGLKVQKLPVIPPSQLRGSEDAYTGQTTDLWNFPAFAGLRYSLNIFEVKNGSGRYFGFFPECRLYFTPVLPRKIIYVENNFPEPDKTITLKGERMSQWAVGIGGGIYWGNYNKTYIALKFETSTIDMFESIRSLDYKNDVFDFKKRQYIISLSLYGLLN